MKKFNIEPIENRSLENALSHKIANKTKPLGALGRLEAIALQIGLIQSTETPELTKPHIAVFAADHGVAREGVSAYPSEVTPQMVFNFLNGGAAINVFSRQNNISLRVIDAGVNYDFGLHDDLIDAKVNYGTRNFLKESAMTEEELRKCFEHGHDIIHSISETGCNVLGFGEMGIGNTSSAALIMSLLLGLPIEECTGRGTGLNDDQLLNKINILKKTIESHDTEDLSPESVLRQFGGFEIAMMCAAMLSAAEKKMIILVDGFIASAAFLCAYIINPLVKDYAFFCHLSEEKGHKTLLKELKEEPLLHLQLRLGEGTGCALAYPVVASAVAFLTEMASFETAGVSR